MGVVTVLTNSLTNAWGAIVTYFECPILHVTC
jgi:hypothetical protein